MSPRHFFMETARRIIQSQKPLRLCADAPERVPGNGISNLPSWVPDWTKRLLTRTFELLNPSVSYFRASKGRFHIDNVQNPAILIAEGKEIDSVNKTLDTKVPNGVTEVERQKALVDDVIPLVVANLQSLASGRKNADLCHTIVNTIIVGACTRTSNIGNSGLQLDAWSETICSYMLPFILGPSGRSTTPPPIDPEQWLYALSREALHCANRRFVVLENNLLALAPKMSIIDDFIVIFSWV
jgi:hypothetical protein